MLASALLGFSLHVVGQVAGLVRGESSDGEFNNQNKALKEAKTSFLELTLAQLRYF